MIQRESTLLTGSDAKQFEMQTKTFEEKQKKKNYLKVISFNFHFLIPMGDNEVTRPPIPLSSKGPIQGSLTKGEGSIQLTFLNPNQGSLTKGESSIQ